MSYTYTLDRGGNAQWFADEFGDRVRYVPESKQWLIWDGMRWAKDQAGQTFRWAATIADELYAESRDPLIQNDEAKRLFAWARTSNDNRTIDGVLRMASTDPRIVAPAASLDADPWLLNVENGTVNLHTGTLQTHKQVDLITKLAPVVFDPLAECVEWGQALSDSTGNDEELIRFLQRAAGATLAGEVRDEVFLFVHGPAGSGKSTVTEPLANVLGDYAVTSQVTTFLSRQRGAGSASSDIARLAGVRMVLTSEPDHGERLASGFIKGLVAADEQTGRPLHKEEFQFIPQLTLWFVSNDRPYVHPGDTGLWRRVLEVPFTHVVAEEDRNLQLKSHLRTDGEARSAIFAWAVKGCLDWQEDGLRVPELVRAASASYQQSMNPLSDFVSDECVLSEEAWTSGKDLYRRYTSWYTGRSDMMMRERSFLKHVPTLSGVSPAKNGAGTLRGFKGIVLVHTPDELEHLLGREGTA